MLANLETSPRKIAFVGHAGSRPKKGLGKADDIGEETGKCTRWDRRAWGPGIWEKTCGDNIGNIPLAAGADGNLHRLLKRGYKPKDRRGKGMDA